MDDILDTIASPVNGQHGTTDTAILVRFPNGTIVPVGVQTGRCAREYLDVYNIDGAEVVGVRRDGVTIDFVAQRQERRLQALALVLLCQTNGIWTDRLARVPDLVMAQRVMDATPTLRKAMLEDAAQLVAAYEGQG